MAESSKQVSSSKRILVMIFVIIMAVCLITDTGIIKTTDLVSKNIMNYWQVPIFFVISCGLLVSQFFLLYFIRKRSLQIGGSKHVELNIIWKIVFGTQLGLSVILLLIMSQVLVLHRYNILLVSVSTIISYQLAIIMMGILAQQFFSWFSVRKNLLVLIYGICFGRISFKFYRITGLYHNWTFQQARSSRGSLCISDYTHMSLVQLWMS